MTFEGMSTEARVAYAAALGNEAIRAAYRRLLVDLVEDIDGGLPLDAIRHRVEQIIKAGTGDRP